MRLTVEEVRRIAVLARVGMTEDEIELMRTQMSHILENIDVLDSANTECVEPTAHSADLESVMRGDSVAESLPLQDVLANAPHREGDFLRVKAVLE